MTELPRPDFYIAAIGRSGSTMLANWLSAPPDRIVFMEPFFLRPGNSRLLRIQLRNIGMAVSDEEWEAADASPLDRFKRIMAPRLVGRRWAVKEVLCEEHVAMTETFAPPRVLVTVRNIIDVALSFFEKHRLQNNLDRFGDDWVAEYCSRESRGILDYLEFLERLAIPSKIVRYEEFICSHELRSKVSGFVGWSGGGDVATNFSDFDRGFESERHGGVIGASPRGRAHRSLASETLQSAHEIAERCGAYQSAFGYGSSGG